MMSKRICPLLMLGVVAAWATWSCGHAPEAEPARLPNVVFILADDLGWADTGVYGSQFFETPNHGCPIEFDCHTHNHIFISYLLDHIECERLERFV